MNNYYGEKTFDKSINGVPLKSLSKIEKYELGLKDGLAFGLEKENELMEKGLYASGEYLRGFLEGIQNNKEQQEASKLHK